MIATVTLGVVGTATAFVLMGTLVGRVGDDTRPGRRRIGGCRRVPGVPLGTVTLSVDIPADASGHIAVTGVGAGTSLTASGQPTVAPAPPGLSE